MKKLLLTLSILFSGQAFANNSPIIWGPTCAFNLFTNACIPTSGGGVSSLGAFGNAPNANGASISGTTLTLQPEDATHPGGLSNSAQTISGIKTFSSTPVFSQNVTVTGSASFASAIATIDGTGTAGFSNLNIGTNEHVSGNSTIDESLTVGGVGGVTSLDNGQITTDGLGNLTTQSLYSDSGLFNTNGSGYITAQNIFLGIGVGQDVMDLAGQCNRYNGIVLAGQGLVNITGNYYTNALAASVGTTTLVTGLALDTFGEVILYLETTTQGTGGTVLATITYTGLGGTTETVTTSTIALNTLGSKVSMSIPLVLKGGTNVSISSTLSGGTGSPKYLMAASFRRDK